MRELKFLFYMIFLVTVFAVGGLVVFSYGVANTRVSMRGAEQGSAPFLISINKSPAPSIESRVLSLDSRAPSLQSREPSFEFYPSVTRQLFSDLFTDTGFDARDDKNQPLSQKNDELKNIFAQSLNQLLANRNLYLLAEALRALEKFSALAAGHWKKSVPYNQVLPKMVALLSSRGELRPSLDKICAGLKVSLILLILAGLSLLSQFFLPPLGNSFQLSPLRL